MRGPLDVTRELIAADVLHEIVHLRRRIDDVTELPEVLGLPGTSCVAVRLYDAGDLLAGELLVAALLPADAAAATTALAAAAGVSTVRRAGPATVSAATDYVASLVCPVGLPAGVRAVAHSGLAAQEVVYTATGDGSTALKIRTADLLALTGAAVASIVEPGVVLDVRRRAAEDAWRGGAGTPVASLRG
jgi:prolyl-tRNA editing enzyme YbaK/EbsC (Cys-tRNA(Pro) deacylase)